MRSPPFGMPASLRADSEFRGAKLWCRTKPVWKVEMSVLDRPVYFGFKQRHEPQLNPFRLKCCVHFGAYARNWRPQ